MDYEVKILKNQIKIMEMLDNQEERYNGLVEKFLDQQDQIFDCTDRIDNFMDFVEKKELWRD